MIIRQFNTELGLYSFTEKGVQTALHAHPALELIVATEGRFSMRFSDAELDGLRLGVVGPNVVHAVQASQCTLDIILVEPGHLTFAQIQQTLGENCTLGLILALNEHFSGELNGGMMQNWLNSFAKERHYDQRIENCMILLTESLEVDQAHFSLKDLSRQVHLSEGRLSHLFKAEIGLPIQKYIIWVRLKNAVQYLIEQESNLNEAALMAGFYDLAHFSRNFKTMMGVKPSQVYNNSRIVQC
jgi:AraC-like DNA-binding protein